VLSEERGIWKECKNSQPVNLGSGRFCITRTLNASSSVGDTDKNITVLTGVEVLPRVQHANDDNGEVGLQMIPYKSLCYKSDDNGLVRLASGWWLRLIYCERKILLADWWLVAGAELV
jgi:hypothetical protein